ncbi:1-phosphofructokinase [Haloarcula sp. JP-Z28]|uniref:1-phosphofructokinase n=1 Tax=Haloarcula sp. JP-Z28 TaxID=2716715 RepID=UPI001404434E|nr:1-phosphofructokinase [Haloarcula sp. JP-Z28]NHN64127.1 1-phosphofructokinase [Haloarcula sp. JP-Z28]
MIVTVTYNPAVDQTIQFDEQMAPERVMRANKAQFDAGGKGINAAQFLTAMDRPCVATGLLGGFTGSFIRETLQDDGVETAFIDVDGTTRLNTTAIAAAEEYKLNQAGPTVGESVVDALLEQVRAQSPDRVLIGGSLPPGLSPDAIDRIAAGGDWETIVDTGGDVLRELDAQYGLCKPNRDELGDATGADVSTVEGCADAAEKFRERGFDRVLASLGADGAVLVGDTGRLYAEALDIDVVDTVGAGDALLSGVLSAWEAGADDETALRTGVAVSSQVVQRAGTAVPDLGDIGSLRDGVTVRRL